MGTLLIGIIVAGIVCLVIWSMVKDKKKGKSLQCGGDCKHCSGHVQFMEEGK